MKTLYGYNFLEFARSNILKVGGGLPVEMHNPLNAPILVNLNQTVGAEIIGVDTGAVYWCSFNGPDDSNQTILRAYWVPTLKSPPLEATRLKNDTDIMLTPTMTGCSFGIGKVNPDGSLPVAHVNASPPGLISFSQYFTYNHSNNQQANIQQHMLYSIDTHQQIISYKQYMCTNNKVDYSLKNTIFAIRQEQVWQFYCLKFRAHGNGRYEHLGVKFLV